MVSHSTIASIANIAPTASLSTPAMDETIMETKMQALDLAFKRMRLNNKASHSALEGKGTAIWSTSCLARYQRKTEKYQQSGCRLFSLPPELRIQIYRYCFSLRRVRYPQQVPLGSKPKLPLNLRLTCRLVNDDTADVHKVSMHKSMLRYTFRIVLDERMTEEKLTYILDQVKPEIENYKRIYITNSESSTPPLALKGEKMICEGLTPSAEGWKSYCLFKYINKCVHHPDSDAFMRASQKHVPMTTIEKAVSFKRLASELESRRRCFERLAKTGTQGHGKRKAVTPHEMASTRKSSLAL
jgi:hypothetical protein